MAGPVMKEILANSLPYLGIEPIYNEMSKNESIGTFTVENVPDDAVLQISYIGFKTLEVPVKGQTTFNITLQRRH